MWKVVWGHVLVYILAWLGLLAFYLLYLVKVDFGWAESDKGEGPRA